MPDGPMRVLDHAWHLAHSYRLHALPATFEYYKVGPRYWDASLRPFPVNFQGMVRQPFMPDYDMILSHLDNWCDRTPLRATPFYAMNALALQNPDALRVCIMHGTPDNEENRQNVKRMLDRSLGGSPFLVTNSRQAFIDWRLGPERSREIIHGYDVEEFTASKERQLWAITVCSAGTISRSYHGVPLLEAIRRHVHVLWIGHNGDIPYFKSYKLYREFLSHSLIYVHPGQRSPMPGARTEAMLSGCCVVSTSNNDAWKYIEHEYTGYLCDTLEQFVETLRMLLADHHKAYKVGKRGRDAARAYFHKDRYVEDWMKLIADRSGDRLAGTLQRPKNQENA